MSEIEVTLHGRPLRMPLRRDRRARNITIHIDASIGGARVVMPISATAAEAERAVRKHARWVLDRIDALPPKIPFEHGAVVPFGGTPHRILHRTDGRGVVERADGVLYVFGRPEHLPRRLQDWLRREAGAAISPLALAKAGMVERTVRRVSIRDTRSRWGSCSAEGRLSFSWRLVLAPPMVLDYVVAHEVAHLVEMNHSPAFWRIVDRLTPHAREAKRWLRANGETLHSYG
jgi:predicted metal-dependent hydrolase